jgi:FHS family glucose/mannose:H+ symporter-like MFS transporter
MNRLIWICCGFYLLIGFTSVIAAALLPELLQHYSRNYADGGNLIFAQFCGFLIGVLSQPWLSKRFGRVHMLSLTLWFIFAGFLILGLLPPWSVVLVSIPLVGFGSGIIEATIGALIIDTIHERKAVAFSRLEVFYGLGAMTMPILISLLIATGPWRLGFFATSLFALLLVIIWSRFSSANRSLLNQRHAIEQPAVPLTTKEGLLPKVMISICFTLFFVYVGLEMSIVNFLPSILLEKMRLDAAFASLSVSFYWGAMVIGRMVCGHLAERYGYKRYLIWSAAGSVLILILFAIVKTTMSAFVVITLLGLLMAGLFTIALIYSNSLFPGKTEQTTSRLIAASGIGGASMSWITGRFMEQTTVSSTLWFFVALSVFMVVLLTCMVKMKPVSRIPGASSHARLGG